ncbi:hypothetical protein ACF064_06780 [Streptomyces sp. NPDC015492]|uniref:hypothetical protein n=1 Tax=Streptomyces sp. NPDC015492 TaxID=3364958 RepID=UPI0036FF0409
MSLSVTESVGGVAVDRGARPGFGEPAFGDGGGAEQQSDGLEPVAGRNPVIDGQGRDQGEAAGGGRPAGVLMEDLVEEVPEEAPVVLAGVDRSIEQHGGLGRPGAGYAVGHDLPEQPPDPRTGTERVAPGL